MTTSEELDNRKISWLITGTVHFILFLLFFFFVAFRVPGPPAEELGVELNFGLDDQGGGDIQPEVAAGEKGDQLPTPNVKEPVPVKQIVEERQEIAKKVDNEVVTTDDEESPVEVEKKIEKPKEKKVEKPIVKEKVEKPAEKAVVAEKTEQKVVKVEEKPKQADVRSLYPTKGPGSGGGGASHGDDKGKVGDKGNPEGSLDARALYGKPGGGGGGEGPALELVGWDWDKVPKPNDQSEESGRVVFEIKVNDDGLIENIRTLEKTVSPEVERIYRREVEKLTFTKKSNAEVPPISTGKITFIIRSR